MTTAKKQSPVSRRKTALVQSAYFNDVPALTSKPKVTILMAPLRRSRRRQQSKHFESEMENAAAAAEAPTLPQLTKEQIRKRSKGRIGCSHSNRNETIQVGARNFERKRKNRRPPLNATEEGTDQTSEPRSVHGISRSDCFYGLIQEIVTPNVFRLLVSTCLLNQTKGKAAIPVFWELLKRWPDEHALSQADVAELTELLQPIGLHNIRARRLIEMSKTMVEIPYDEARSYKSRDRSAPDTPIGIYPGVGRYAIDSWRIFVADGGASAGLNGERPICPFDLDPPTKEIFPSRSAQEADPEWQKVMPLDKELRAYLVWRWAKEGRKWDPISGLAPSAPC